MGSHNENLEEPRSEPVAAGLAPLDELQTDEVPDSLVSEFSSLTTPYCWVITEDAVAGYDGAEPSAVGRSGPDRAVAEDVAEALTAGRFFRLVDGSGPRARDRPAVRPERRERARAAGRLRAAEPGCAQHRVPGRGRLAGGLTTRR